MERKKHHLVVVGAGSGGFAAARTARDLGADVALVDHGPLGGLCILRGCMPSKTLIASSDAAQDMRDAAELGIHAGNIEIDFPHIMRRKRELIKGFADYRIDGIHAFPLYEGRARFVSPNELLVDEKLLIEGKKFIIATGSVVAPAAAVHGLEETGYIDSDGALELERLPKSLIVLGGGYIGCELGQFFSRMGVKTSIVLRSRHLLSGEDHDIGDALTQYYRDEGIEVHTGTQIMRTSKRNGNKVVHVVRNEVEGDLEAEELLYCLGRVPNFEGLDLDVANVPCHHITGIETDATMRTCNPDFYAIGDVAGKHMLVHVAIYEGEIAARNAVTGSSDEAVYDLVKTHTVFSDPQVAVVGATERELQSTGVAYVKGTYDFAEHGKAQCINKTKGFVKIMASADDGKILGAAILGPHGSDLIHEMIVAMRYGSTVKEFMAIPHLHPTLAEIWTYPAEECAAKLQLAGPGEVEPEVALGGTAG
ncbi:MAG TPA: dihydrolipoyl dehydrogenase [Candidatus Baltobacteraceae bacterium]|jgi:pyruvate/2-oxoglutarate dehydrogenase complex dihydrolipoamide dehydrogenase (E3) component|nr:dihydrolipoyl dehydrogenase [Candidatus Baltobacteraceae bacterium]